jgi:hypothetical protein
MPGGGHFDTDATRADDREAAGHRTAIGGFPVGPRPGFGNARQIRKRCAASRADDNSVPDGERRYLATCRGDRNAAGPVQSSMAAHQSCSDSGYPIGLTGVIPVAHVAVPATEDADGVDRTVDRLPRTVDMVGIGYRDDRARSAAVCPTGPAPSTTTS